MAPSSAPVMGQFSAQQVIIVPLSKLRSITRSFIPLFFALIFILTARAVLGAPVAPDEVTIRQPDGRSFAALPFGDEWYSGYEHQGFTILRRESDGFWVYAQPIAAGRLVPGSLVVGQQSPSGLAPHLRDALLLSEVAVGKAASGVSAAGDPAAPEAAAAWPGASGTQPLLILLVDFTPSTSLGTTAAQWHDAMFKTTGGAKSVKSFYEQASFNQFSVAPAAEIQGTVNDGIVQVTLGYAHPNTGASTGTANRQLVRDALIAADPYVNYGSFDLNSNGYLDVSEIHLIVIPRGFETSYGGAAAACAPNVWGHRSALGGVVAGPVLDGVVIGESAGGGGYMQFGEWHRVNTVTCASGGNMATIGIMAHELGHDIDWPDLYDTDGSSSGVGYWSVMSGGSWGRASGEPIGTTPTLPDAFSKWYQKWITPTAVTTTQSGVAIPNAAQNPVAYQLLPNPNGIDWDFGDGSGIGEYFLVENRQQVGFDAGLFAIGSSSAGCIIWHIDESVTSSNANNNDESHKHVDVEEANPTQQNLDGGPGGNSGDANDPWPGSNNLTAFGAGSTPNSNLYSGAASMAEVINISTAGTGCTVDFLVPPNLEHSGVITTYQTPTQTVTSTLSITNTGSFTLTWTIQEDQAPAGVSLALDGESAPAEAGVVQATAMAVPELVAASDLVITRTLEAAYLLEPGSTSFPAPLALSSSSVVSFILDDGTRDTNVGLGGGSFLWFNRFTPNTADFPIRLDTISIYFYGGLGVSIGQQITLYVYEDTDGDGNPKTGPSLIGTYPTTVQSVNAFNVYTLSPAPVLNGPGDVLIGFFNNTAGTNPPDYPMSADTTSPQSRSWYGTTTVSTWASTSSFNWMIRGSGTAVNAACAVPENVSWLSLSATAGSTISNTVSTVDVTLDSTGLTPAIYEAVLCIDSNDPEEPQVQLPVSMQVCAAPVTPSALSIAKNGSDIDLAWSGSATQFEIWWHTAPYMQAGVDCGAAANCATSGATSYTHVGGGDGSSDYFYTVLAVDSCGGGTVSGQAVSGGGVFSFPITPGTP